MKEIKLFKSVVADKTEIKTDYIKEWFVYNFDMNQEILNWIIDFILSWDKANKSFHKSWWKIQNSDIEQLLSEQILHYFSTYWMESIWFKSINYIPVEKLNIPELKEHKLLFIQAISEEELKEKVKTYIQGAIKEVDDIKELIVKYNLFTQREISDIKNIELKISLFEEYNIIPDDSVEYLRYLIYKSTWETLLIKNKFLIEKIKEWINIDSLLLKAPDNLAEIFLRFKPLFLALKYNSNNKTFFNKLRQKAKKIHKPLKQDYLSILSTVDTIDYDKLINELKTKDINRIVRLYNALLYRTKYDDVISYKIRNWKSRVSTEWNNKRKYTQLLSFIKSFIKERVNSQIWNKKVYVPNGVHYAFPTSDKNFIWYIPEYSYITTTKNFIVGVYWENQWWERIDLDLSYLDWINKWWWDWDYRSNDMLFSWDITDAPDWATELFYIKNNDVNVLFKLNNFNSNIAVNYKLFIAVEDIDNLTENYLVNPNNIITKQEDILKQRQAIIWYMNKSKFYFVKSYDWYCNSSSNSSKSKDSKLFLQNKTNSVLMLEDIVEITNDKQTADINLSLDKLDKNSFKLFIS